MCVRHPRFDSDIVVTTDAVALMRVFSGIDSLASARRAGSVVLAGPPALTGSFEQWFLWSPFAPAVRDELAARSSMAP